ncbi:uncharacterized protein LOC110821075 [Carica papaya]|uniref:uncharacterized protein LOC110821075 n=1 Tax=Carica papaya TaxID=3649 RepID=UPI000B8D00FD|nr:uncharacterized protein LOC110821075 [Carica papaya]
MALHLARPKHRSLANPSLIHLFSTSSTDQNPPNDAESAGSPAGPSSQSSFSSYFSDVKASLKERQHQKPQRSSSNSASNNPTSRKVVSLEEIRKNLSEFRRRSTVPSPTESNSQPHVSFQELYKRNVIAKSEGSGGTTADSGTGKGVRTSFEAIRESLRQMRLNTETGNEKKGPQKVPLSSFMDSLRLKPKDSPNMDSTVIGGTETLPFSVFGKEMKERKDGEGGEGNEAMKTEFVKMYSYGELGEKLRMLRPETKGGKAGKRWFSLQELNERLIKLREMEKKETESRISGVPYKDLRLCLVKLKKSDEEKTKRTSIQRIDILGQLGGTPDFMLLPPKEHLVEKYFHPDNMSSAEKMKIELTKVREEFKMSESDCGSARVQVAQLTTKIKHLSSTLHKKDKHSRKGLQGMVQKRKKLLKYLRRTDWDSYCFVISKLGLRDNPDYKN